MQDLTRLIEIIEPEAKALGFDLVRVKMTQSEAGAEAKKSADALQIMAEDPATGQLIIDQCAALSRAVSEAIDAAEEAGEELIPSAYHLEVSSPGIDRPLTREKDFANWAGHDARIVMVKGFSPKDSGIRRVYKGPLKGIEDGIITITDSKSGDVGALPFGEVHTAKLVLTDALIAATQPLDTSGADDIIEDSNSNEEEKA